jgi:hypothetical protein
MKATYQWSIEPNGHSETKDRGQQVGKGIGHLSSNGIINSGQSIRRIGGQLLRIASSIKPSRILTKGSSHKTFSYPQSLSLPRIRPNGHVRGTTEQTDGSHHGKAPTKLVELGFKDFHSFLAAHGIDNLANLVKGLQTLRE